MFVAAHVNRRPRTHTTYTQSIRLSVLFRTVSRSVWQGGCVGDPNCTRSSIFQFKNGKECQESPLFPLRRTNFGKFAPNCGNNSGVLRLSRTPRQSISCVSSIRNRIFSGVLFHEVRFRKFFSCGSG